MVAAVIIVVSAFLLSAVLAMAYAYCFAASRTIACDGTPPVHPGHISRNHSAE